MDTYGVWSFCKVVQLILIQEFMLYVGVNSAETYDVTPMYRYGVMLDVGSSSTKLRLYKWPKRDSKTEIPKLQDFYDKKYKPSLTSYANDLESVPGYLQEMIERAKEVIPDEMHSDTPIYAIATAGMRILNSTASSRVFNVVRSHLSNSSVCPFKFYPRQARISSGEEEGVFAWISVNYLKGAFSNGKTLPSHFTGVLEMGGGSTQITFLPEGPIYAGKFPVQIAGRIYPLYSHSYLMYGQNYINERINNHLISQSRGVRGVYNPCMLRGDIRRINGISIVGSGDWMKCETLLANFLKTAPDNWCFPKPCAIGRTYQPSVKGKRFYGIAGFLYTPRDLGMGPTLIPTELREMAKAHCNKTIDEAVGTDESNRRFASPRCLMGLYIPMLLTEAYDFPPGTRAITASNTIGDNKIAWTMGAMLYEIERLEFIPDEDTYVEDAPLCHSSTPGLQAASSYSHFTLIMFSLLIGFASAYVRCSV